MNVTSHTITTPDGRKLRVFEGGKPDGIPVLTHHGTPGSGMLYAPFVEDAASRGIRLIGYDRPGYGGSSPQPGRTVASAVEDVAAIAKELKLERLLTWGHSGGGPHALACAALLPGLVAAAASLASPAPYPQDGFDWMAGMGEDNLAEFGAALEGRRALEKFLDVARPAMLMATPGTIVQALQSLLSQVDVDVITEEMAGFLLESTRAGIEKSAEGWVEDDLAFITPWGFDPARIHTPLLLMQGAQDRMVPYSHGQWLAGQVSGADVRLLPEDGHITLSAKRIPEVHEWLLSKW